MSERLNQSRNIINTNKRKLRTKSKTGIVVDVILDETHPRLANITEETDYFSDIDTSYIPAAIIRPYGDSSTSDTNLPIYKPFDYGDITMPLIGESVEIVRKGNSSFFKRFPSIDLNKGNARANANKNLYASSNDSNAKNNNYNETSGTGTSNTEVSERDSNLGTYFIPTQINRLRLYEGDKLIQSRFGQSIRFSGYNNDGNVFSPTILIRNRQNDESINNLKNGDVTEEDINKDGTTIAITSGNYKLNFQPGSIDDGGNSNFKTNTKLFPLPNEYTGLDQVLINTGRLILSSKDSEMIFFSKGNYGFISDGKFIIDNGSEGADLNFNGSVNLTTNDNDISVNTGQANLLLNTENTEQPILRGQATVELIEKLIDLILAQSFSTGTGPTATGPLNRAEFEELKTQLTDLKSTLNFTE